MRDRFFSAHAPHVWGAALCLACGAGARDADDSGTGITDPSAGDPSGGAASEVDSTGGDPSGDPSGADASSGDTSTGDPDPTGGPPEDPPMGAEPGPVAAFGVPFDPSQEFYPGPPEIIPDGKPQLVAHRNPNGSIDVAWLDTASPQIVVTQLEPSGDGWATRWHWPVPTIDRLAGYARDEDGNRFYVTAIAEDLIIAETTPSGEHRDGIARVHGFAKGGTELFTTDLRNDVGGSWDDPLVGPMAFGTGRIAVGGGTVGITFSCLTEYDPVVMSRHQRQCFHLVDTTTGTQTGHIPGPGHSWEQRIVWDGDRFVAVLHGDAGLRGIGVFDYGVDNTIVERVAFAIKGGDPSTGGAYQNTFTRLGNLVPTTDGYALLFATEHDPVYTGSAVIASRNLVFAHVRSDFEATNPPAQYDVQIVDTMTQNPAATDFQVSIVDYWGSAYTGYNRGLVWLTDHDDPVNLHVENPDLVRLDDGRLIALWEQWTTTAPTGLWGMLVDEWGRVLEAPRLLGDARLYRGDDAISLGDRAAWVVGDASVPQLVLHTVDDALELRSYALP